MSNQLRDTRMSRRQAFGRMAAIVVGGTALARTTLQAGDAFAAPALDEVLRTVSASRDGLKTLSGPFTQERTIGLLSAKVKSSGTLTLVRPDRLRWELAAPDGVVYWVGPEGLAYKSARGGQGRVPPTHARIAAALDDLRLVLAGDLGSLRTRYDLTLLPPRDGSFAADAGAETVHAFSAVPKDKAAKLKRIDFELDSTGGPRRVVLVEGAKDNTEILFGKLIRDAAVDPAIMRPAF